MSTKIPSGFRIAEGTDFTAFKERVRALMDPIRDQEDLKLLAIETAKYVDSQWLAGDPILPGAAEAAHVQWATAQSKMSAYDYDHDLNRFELSIGTDPGNGRIMVIVRAENHVLLGAFEDLPEVEEYGYWDHTDSYPEGVTSADWKVREAAWERALPGIKISDTMDTWTLRDTAEIRDDLRSLDSGNADLFLSHVLAAEDRARSAGLDAYADYLHQEQGVEVMRAVQHVAFGRGVSARPVIDAVASYLPTVTLELITEGSGGAVIDPCYRDAVRAVCEYLYESDKVELARKD